MVQCSRVHTALAVWIPTSESSQFYNSNTILWAPWASILIYTYECTHIHIWIIKNKIHLKKENNPNSTSINILSSLVCVFHWLSTEIISELDVYEVQA